MTEAPAAGERRRVPLLATHTHSQHAVTTRIADTVSVKSSHTQYSLYSALSQLTEQLKRDLHDAMYTVRY